MAVKSRLRVSGRPPTFVKSILTDMLQIAIFAEYAHERTWHLP